MESTLPASCPNSEGYAEIRDISFEVDQPESGNVSATARSSSHDVPR